jgi:hypothetical protein
VTTRAALTVLAVALALPGGAFAAAISISATPTTATASAVTLNGDDQSATFTETLAIGGVTQSLGYNVTAWAPVPAVGALTLSALKAGAPTLSCTQGSCTTGTNSVIGYPLVLGTTSGAAVKIFNATAGSANKNQQAIVTFSIPVTADRLPGTYTTTLTLTVADGP